MTLESRLPIDEKDPKKDRLFEILDDDFETVLDELKDKLSSEAPEISWQPHWFAGDVSEECVVVWKKPFSYTDRSGRVWALVVSYSETASFSGVDNDRDRRPAPTDPHFYRTYTVYSPEYRLLHGYIDYADGEVSQCCTSGKDDEGTPYGYELSALVDLQEVVALL